MILPVLPISLHFHVDLLSKRACKSLKLYITPYTSVTSLIQLYLFKNMQHNSGNGVVLLGVLNPRSSKLPRFCTPLSFANTLTLQKHYYNTDPWILSWFLGPCFPINNLAKEDCFFIRLLWSFELEDKLPGQQLSPPDSSLAVLRFLFPFQRLLAWNMAALSTRILFRAQLFRGIATPSLNRSPVEHPTQTRQAPVTWVPCWHFTYSMKPSVSFLKLDSHPRWNWSRSFQWYSLSLFEL